MKWLCVGGGIVIVAALVFLGCLFKSDTVKDVIKEIKDDPDGYKAHMEEWRDGKAP